MCVCVCVCVCVCSYMCTAFLCSEGVCTVKPWGERCWRVVSVDSKVA